MNDPENGYCIAVVPCINCGRSFGCNPVKVPSVRINGIREPLCELCVDAYNERRLAAGLEAFPVPADAYQPAPVSVLDEATSDTPEARDA